MGWPHFFIVGTAKGGTTSLYEYLRQHPEVSMSQIKEPHFFCQFSKASAAWAVTEEQEYLALFSTSREVKVVGEASPSYLWHDQAPYRIRDRIPNARSIILLRDPIERAYSHYLMDVRDGRQALPFYEALVADIENPYKDWLHAHLYVELGMYADQVRRYVELFGGDQVLVLMSEHLKRDPNAVLHRVTDFLGISSSFVGSIQTAERFNAYAGPRNALTRFVISQYSRTWAHHAVRALLPKATRQYVRNSLLLKRGAKPPLDPRAVALLKPLYEPEIAELEELLQRKLPELRKVW